MVGEGNNLKPKATRILESYIKSIFTLVQIQYAEQPEGRGFDSLPATNKILILRISVNGNI